MRLLARLLIAWLLLSPSGLVGAAIQPSLSFGSTPLTSSFMGGQSLSIGAVTIDNRTVDAN